MKNKNLIVTGPTATGKTTLAVSLARKFDGEIISADSRQVYRGLDIGTGKDIEEYGARSNAVPYHLIDISPADEEYNLMRFKQDAPRAISEILNKKKLPIIAGGTPLYIDSLISDYEMEGGATDKGLRTSLKKLDLPELLEMLRKEDSSAYENLKQSTNHYRIIRAIEKKKVSESEDIVALPEDMEWLILGVYYHRKEVHKRIEERLDRRLEEGMVEEAERLHKEGLSWEKLEFFGLEYKYLAYYLQGKLSYQEMRDQLLIKIRQFAKRQDIWFRKMEREGHIIHWIKHGDFNEASKLVRMFLNDSPLPASEIKISEIDYGKK
jgi:tRNA dimethylallyltransferase